MTERICRDCRFMRGQHANPAFGFCRAVPPQMVGGGISWPPVRIVDETIEAEDGREIVQLALHSYCFMFKPRVRWWQFWKFGGGGLTAENQVGAARSFRSPPSDTGGEA